MNDVAARELRRMLEHVAAGGRVIIGCQGAPPGRSDSEIIGGEIQTPFGFYVRVKRRATRQEFIDCAPPEDRAKAERHRSPCYYEVEPVDTEAPPEPPAEVVQ